LVFEARAREVELRDHKCAGSRAALLDQIQMARLLGAAMSCMSCAGRCAIVQPRSFMVASVTFSHG
jgi:hypothetical protein